jgi:hypothetical protein
MRKAHTHKPLFRQGRPGLEPSPPLAHHREGGHGQTQGDISHQRNVKKNTPALKRGLGRKCSRTSHAKAWTSRELERCSPPKMTNTCPALTVRARAHNIQMRRGPSKNDSHMSCSKTMVEALALQITDTRGLKARLSLMGVGRDCHAGPHGSRIPASAVRLSTLLSGSSVTHCVWKSCFAKRSRLGSGPRPASSVLLLCMSSHTKLQATLVCTYLVGSAGYRNVTVLAAARGH